MDTAQENNVGDAELIAAVRLGDDDASSELFRRHHGAALAFAASLAGESLASDLVSESFAKILILMQRGQGPDVAFRPYLLTAIRRAHVDHIRRTHREVSVDDVEVASAGTAMVSTDGVDNRFEAATILRAYRSLPERWQAVLWLTAVEHEPLQRVAEHLGMNANSVAALSFRAREGLRRAYLAEHLASTQDPECRAISDLLARHVRGALPRRQSQQVTAHVAGCLACTAGLADLQSINSNLGAVLAPAVLGGPLSEQVLAHFSTPAPNEHTWAIRFGIGAAVGITAVGITALLVLAVAHDGRNDEPGTPTAHVSIAVTQPTSITPTSPLSATPRVEPTPKQEPAPVAPVVETPPAQELVEQPIDSPKPAATPSAAPTPSVSATPSLPPSALDVALGIPSQQQLTTTVPYWFHVRFPVTGLGADLVIRVQLANVAKYQVHTDHDFGHWQCAESALTSMDRVLSCTLQAESSRSQDFALDVSPGDAPASVEAVVRLASGRDPHPENNRAVIEVLGTS